MLGFQFFCIFAALSTTTLALNKRFEYKHSFKGPHLVQKDRTVPFWTYVGNAIASDDFVRLAPSLKSQRGLIWNKIPSDFDNWEVELTFKVAGRGRVGADGLAFWYTMENEALTGPVFGARDQWNGLGVFFDSFDNDAQSNNPYISAHINDGTKKYDHYTDGSTQQLGGCVRDYRNKPYPVKAKVRYENRVLTLRVHTGLTNTYNDESFELCLRAEALDLAKGGYFSVSAATGGLADDHDVISLITHSLRTDDEMKTKQGVAEDEKAKYEKEFEEYDKKLEEAKTEYQKENPDAANQQQENQEYFDSNVQELRMIFEGQDHIHQAINGINRRLSELIGTSQQISSQVALLQGASAGSVAHGGGAPASPPPPQAGASPIQRHEVDHLVRASNDLIQGVNSLKATVEAISREKRSADPPAFADRSQHQVTDGINEIKVAIQRLSADTQNQMRNSGGGAPVSCPNINCVSTAYFGAFIVGQLVILIMYSVYMSRKEAAAKKFY